MKIKKIKSQGEFCYPATIAAAVKDANFKKDGSIPMTLGEVNLYLHNLVIDNQSEISGIKQDLTNKLESSDLPVMITGGSQTTTSTESGGSNVFTFNKSDGSSTTFTVKNGAEGSSGKNLEFAWSGTKLGVRQEGLTTYTLKDLKGATGPTGPSPVMASSKNGDVTTITADGTAIATINDGHSPIITASKSGKVTTISLDGNAIATINDGNDGNDGAPGSTPTLPALGGGYGTCSTAAATAAKVGTLANYVLTTGGIVAIKFTYAVPANATLNINSKGAKYIYYNGAKITANVIGAGNIATFMYDGTNYVLLGIVPRGGTTTSTTPTITASGGDWICSASTITKLTINTITKNAAETNIYFKTGTTFSLSVPASTKFIGDINFEASTEYVISIKFGIMVVRKVEGQTS